MNAGLYLTVTVTQKTQSMQTVDRVLKIKLHDIKHKFSITSLLLYEILVNQNYITGKQQTFDFYLLTCIELFCKTYHP